VQRSSNLILEEHILNSGRIWWKPILSHASWIKWQSLDKVTEKCMATEPISMCLLLYMSECTTSPAPSSLCELLYLMQMQNICLYFFPPVALVNTILQTCVSDSSWRDKTQAKEIDHMRRKEKTQKVITDWGLLW
jgi:hypothetical protein